MSGLFRRETIGIVKAPHGDDVTLVHNGAIWMVVSEATLGSEQIMAHRLYLRPRSDTFPLPKQTPRVRLRSSDPKRWRERLVEPLLV